MARLETLARKHGREDDPCPSLLRLLRRYVIRRASGKPASEYVRLVNLDGMAAWLECSEREARAGSRWQRVRQPSQPWCPVLGNRLGIAEDVALMAFFETVPDDDWRRHEIAVRTRPTRCLREWRETGRRLIAASRAMEAGHRTPGKLAGWPVKRGAGPRSLRDQRRTRSRE